MEIAVVAAPLPTAAVSNADLRSSPTHTFPASENPLRNGFTSSLLFLSLLQKDSCSSRRCSVVDGTSTPNAQQSALLSPPLPSPNSAFRRLLLPSLRLTMRRSFASSMSSKKSKKPTTAEEKKVLKEEKKLRRVLRIVGSLPDVPSSASHRKASRGRGGDNDEDTDSVGSRKEKSGSQAVRRDELLDWTRGALENSSDATRDGQTARQQQCKQHLGDQIDFSSFESQTGEALEGLQMALAEIRVGRARAEMFEAIPVFLHGSKSTPLGELGQVVVRSAHMVIIACYDEGHLPKVRAALSKADRSWIVDQDGVGKLKLQLPKVSAEGREKMRSEAKQLCEITKAKLRKERQTMRKVIKEEAASTAWRTSEEARLQRLVDAAVHAADRLFESKVKELSSA